MYTDDVITIRKLAPCDLRGVTVAPTAVNHLTLLLFVVHHGDLTARTRFYIVWVPTSHGESIKDGGS